ncbi:MAG: hypothetical protein ACNYPE_17705 [Candidatus Azotimanducaceae bacterium WSBS_2022_MAG_OTU7]
MNRSISIALILALTAAVGNALFAYGQIRAAASANLFLYITYTLVFCIFLFVIAMTFLPRSVPVDYLLENRWWIVVSVGYFLTFTGFYFLYTQFGASYYALYAILSILITSLVVGAFILRESFNIYYGFGLVTAALTIVLFAIGQPKQATPL